MTMLASNCFVGMHLKACGSSGDGYARETSELFVCRIWLLGPSLAQLPTSSGSSLNRLNSRNGCAAKKLQHVLNAVACFEMHSRLVMPFKTDSALQIPK